MSDYHLQQLAAASASAETPSPVNPTDVQLTSPDFTKVAEQKIEALDSTPTVSAGAPDSTIHVAALSSSICPTTDATINSSSVGQPVSQPVSSQMPTQVQQAVGQPVEQQVSKQSTQQVSQENLRQTRQEKPQLEKQPASQSRTTAEMAHHHSVRTHLTPPTVQILAQPSNGTTAQSPNAHTQPVPTITVMHPSSETVGTSVSNTARSIHTSHAPPAVNDNHLNQVGTPSQTPPIHMPLTQQVHIASTQPTRHGVAIPHATTPVQPLHATSPYAQHPHQQSHHIQHSHHPQSLSQLPHSQNSQQPPPQTQTHSQPPLHTQHHSHVQPHTNAQAHHSQAHHGQSHHPQIHHTQSHHPQIHLPGTNTHVQPNPGPYHSGSTHGSIQPSVSSPTGIPSLPPVNEQLSLENKYHQKCNECNALRHELELKNSELRKLKQELYKKSSSTLISKANSFKSTTPALAVDGEKIIIDVDIGPSSSRTRSYDQRWKARFQDLVKYKLQHGDCVVPKSYKDKGLHSWVRKQRILKKDFDLGLASDESMTKERVNALNSIGFAWVVGHQSNDAQWEQNFQDLVVFKSQFGHTRVPQSYEKSLHKWVLNQRCRRRLLEEKGEGKAKGMTWARVEKLDAIDFSWSGKK